MNRNLTFLVTAFVVAVLCPLQPFAQETQPTGSVDPFLWEVTGPSGTTHLFGTIHLGIAVEELPSVVGVRFDTSESLFIEADIQTIDPWEMLAMSMLPEGESLTSHIDPDTWNRVTELLGQTGMAVGEPERMQPWMLEMLLVASVVPQTAPMDMVFLEEAQVSGKELGYLEIWRDQIGMMNELPLEMTISDLLEWVNDGETAQAELSSLLDAYRAGDAVLVESLMFDPEDLAERPEFYEQLIYQRNENWMPTVRTAIEQGDVFIAVGLGHLLGPRGLVEQLRGEGYVVERVSGGL